MGRQFVVGPFLKLLFMVFWTACNCSNQSAQSGTESRGNVTYTSPAVAYSGKKFPNFFVL